jgi:hypothetical protein
MSSDRDGLFWISLIGAAFSAGMGAMLIINGGLNINIKNDNLKNGIHLAGHSLNERHEKGLATACFASGMYTYILEERLNQTNDQAEKEDLKEKLDWVKHYYWEHKCASRIQKHRGPKCWDSNNGSDTVVFTSSISPEVLFCAMDEFYNEMFYSWYNDRRVIRILTQTLDDNDGWKLEWERPEFMFEGYKKMSNG